MRVDEVPTAILGALVPAEIHRYNEDPGTKALARQIHGALTQQPYPHAARGGSCDLVIPVDGGSVWVERKNAWTYSSATSKATGRNPAYSKHLSHRNCTALNKGVPRERAVISSCSSLRDRHSKLSAHATSVATLQSSAS